MRMIDADDLRQVLDVYSEKDSLGHTPVQLCDAMPTIDAVEVVHCKECRWGHLCVFGQHLGLDGFCSKGERKEQNNETDRR